MLTEPRLNFGRRRFGLNAAVDIEMSWRRAHITYPLPLPWPLSTSNNLQRTAPRVAFIRGSHCRPRRFRFAVTAIRIKLGKNENNALNKVEPSDLHRCRYRRKRCRSGVATMVEKKIKKPATSVFFVPPIEKKN